MNTWKKIFTLSLVAFQMSTFAISNTAHAADGVITLSDLHSSKYSLNSNTNVSFGKLYSPSDVQNAKKYSLMTSDNGGTWNQVADGVQGTPNVPTSIGNTEMSFNPETSPWQNDAVYVDFQLTGDDTTLIEKSAKRCYDTKVVGGNSNIKYEDQVGIGHTDYVTNVMQDIIVDPDNDDSSQTTWNYYQHGDGLGYGSDRIINDGKFGTNNDYQDYLDSLEPGDDRMSKSEFYGEYKNPHLYILCRSSGTKWTRIHQLYAISKMEFTVAHAEDVNGNDVRGNVAIDASGIQYDTSPLTPQEVFSQYASYSPQTFNMNRVKGTLKIDGANGNKNVAANIVINAKVVQWALVGWGFLEPEYEGPVGQQDWPQCSRIYPQWDTDGHWWNNQGGYWNGYWHDGYWNDQRTYDKAITSANGYTPVTINLSYNRNSYSSYDDGYNIDETAPYDLISKSWYGYNTSQSYNRGAFGVIGNWVNQDITTQIYSKDNLSGIDTDRSYVYIDDKSWYGRDDNTRHYFDPGSEQTKQGYKQYANEDQLTFTQDGIYYVVGKLWDVADNYHLDSGHGAFKLDKTKPDIPLYSDDTRTYIDDPYSVTVTLRDNLSGIDHAVWAISRNSSTYNGETQHLENITTPENSPNAATTFSVPIDSNGTWYIHTWVTDRAGNTTYKVSNGYKFFKITPDDVTVNPTSNGSNILRGTRFDVVTTIPYFTQEDGNNSILHYIMPNWVNDDVDKKVNGQYSITPGTGSDTHCAQYGPTDQAILWKAYVVPYGVPLTKNKDGNVIGSYQTVVIRLQYTNYIYGEKITHDLPIDYSVIPEVVVKTEIINNPL